MSFGCCIENRSKKWAINTRRLDLMKKDTKYLYQNIRICGDHFEDEMFTNSSKKTLTRDATPTLFTIPNPPPQTGQKRQLLYREESTSCSKRTCLINKLSRNKFLNNFTGVLNNINIHFS